MIVRLRKSESATDAFDLMQKAIGREALIGRAPKDEPFERFQIDCVRRHAGVKNARALRRRPDRPGMTNGAVEKDAIDTLSVAA